MRTRSVLLAAFLALPLSAAASEPERFGKPLTGAPKVELAKLVESPEKWSGKTVTTEGAVAAVCAQKGCWMTLGEAANPVRVTFKDYSYFVPKDIAGATVVVEGVFKVAKIPEATAKHYAEETPGGKPEAIKGDQKELTFVATGVELRRAAK